jgi:hypothetical protein
MPNVKLVAASTGVSAFVWNVPTGAHQIVLTGAAQGGVPGWVIPGSAGTPVRTGAVGLWHARTNGATGYVASGDYWSLLRGAFHTAVNLAGRGPAQIQVWDNTTGKLLAQRKVASGSSRRTGGFSFRINRVRTQRLYTGWGIWRTQMQPPPAGDVVGVRVWLPDDGSLSIYQVAITRSYGTRVNPEAAAGVGIHLQKPR